MKTTKIIFALIAMLLCSISANAHDFEVDGIYYQITSSADLTVKVSYKGSSSFPYSYEYSGSVTIPESVTYNGITYSVTSIGAYAFYNCSGLTSVTIPNSVTSIGQHAFYYCSGLTSVHISDIAAWCKIDFATSDSNPLKYAKHLFLDGEEIKDLVIPNSVTSIGDYAFEGCSSLTSVTIPNSVTSIGNEAFINCYGLTSVSIPNSVTSIGDFAFYNCSSLTSIEIPNSVTSIGGYAFYDCYHLTSVSIPNSVTSIGSYAFYNCSSLTSIEIPNSVTSIGGYAFYNCYGLTSVSIPNNVTSIEEYTFCGCSGLTSVTIPNSVTSIGVGAFVESGLTSITIPNNVKKIDWEAFAACSNLVSIEIGDGITYFGDCVFDNTPWYEKQPDGVIYINNLLYAYKGDMPDNTSVVIKDGTTCIAGNAFRNLTGLTSVTIPNSVTSISYQAFYGCPDLTSVTIPNSVKSIGDNAFSLCVSLTSIVVEDGNAVYDSRNNCNAIIETSTDKLIVGCRNTIIPNTVTSIGDDAFSCSGLTSVTIPNSVTSIGDYAFYNCYGLTSVTIPNSVTSIGYDAFSDCPNLTEATVGCKWKENPVYTFDSNVTVNATLHSYTDGICTECGHSDTSSPAVIIDGAVTEYSVAVERACPITYTRTFNNTEWQALYVPFAMSYDDWKEDFDVAKINDIHQFDVNNDGDFEDAEDKTIMEMLKVNSGTLKANHPYMIRAKSTGEKSITIENATLMPTEVNSIDCSSVERKYVFTGTYNTIDGETMVNNKYYAMSGGGVKYTTSTSVSLKPFRWYMQIMDRDGQLLESATEIKVVVSGEDDWDVTGIESVKEGDGTFKVFSIGGVLVRSVKAADIKQATEGLPKGLYIVNGKKCNVR